MSAVLKSGSSALRAKVRPLMTAPRAIAPIAPDPELEMLRAALAEAETALAARDETIAGLPGQVETAFAEGEAKGRAAVEDAQAERLAALQYAAEQALDLYAKEMASLERLAALLARACLDRMLLGSGDRARIVAELLRARLAEFEAGAAVRIQVSAEDFDSPEALAEIAAAPCEIVASPSLKSGDCTIKLRLGGLEVGIGQQWGTLREALEEMAA